MIYDVKCKYRLNEVQHVLHAKAIYLCIMNIERKKKYVKSLIY